MTYPDLKLRVAFALDPLDPTPATDADWTDFDVDGSVFSADIVTGKQQAFDDLQPGTFSALLDNQDRRYDPLNPAGPYYGNLVPGKRMQFTATYSGVEYPLYNGFVDGYRLGYGQLTPGPVTMACTDAVKYLRQPLVTDPVSQAVMADGPTAYYRLGETTGQVLVDSSGNGKHGWWSADLKDLHTDGLAGAYDGALKLPGLDANTSGTIPASVLTDLSSFSIEFWFKADSPPKSFFSNALFDGLVSLGAVYVDLVPAGGALSGSLTAFISDQPNHYAWANTNASGTPPSQFNVCDGHPHLISIAYDGAQLRVYVDGVDRTLSHAQSGTLSGGLGTPIPVNKGSDWDGDVVLDEVAFFAPDTDASRQARWAAELGQWDGDETGARFLRVMDTIGWTAATANTGSSRLGKAKWSAGTKAGDYVGLLASSEQGQLVVAHWDYGGFEFRDRTWIQTDGRSTTVQAVFSDQPDDDPDTNPAFILGTNPDQPPGVDVQRVDRCRYESIELLYDESTAIRQVTVNWDGGSVTVVDPTASSTDVLKSATVDTILPTEDAARSLANWLLVRYADVFLQVRSIKVMPTAHQDTLADREWKAILSLREGDRIRIERQPGGTGALWQFDCIIEGREHHLAGGVEQWETTFWCTPVDSSLSWILDVTPFDDTVLSF